jgi:hypothetical protein
MILKKSTSMRTFDLSLSIAAKLDDPSNKIQIIDSFIFTALLS